MHLSFCMKSSTVFKTFVQSTESAMMLFIFVIKLPILISDIFLGSSPACT